jgi:FlaA1/EpsC-like NDP-sugar epimerase
LGGLDMDKAGTGHGEPGAHNWRVRLAQGATRVRSDLSFALIDAVVVSVAYSAALILRFIDVQGIPDDWLPSFALALPLIVGIHLAFNLVFGAYGHVWEYASVEEAMRLVYASLLASSVIVAGVMVIRQTTGESGPMPLTVALTGALVALGGMEALRFRSRLFSFKKAGEAVEPLRTLVVGTGRPAAELARHGSPNARARNVEGFVTGNGDERSPRRLAGRPVLGTLSDLAHLVEEFDIQEVIIATHIDQSGLRDLVDSCMEVEVRLRILPALDDVLSDDSHLRDIRDLELDDLLPRPTLTPDLTGSSELLSGARVLVTGAGGSIGSEMVRQLTEMSATVIALDNDETHLHDAMLTWRRKELVETVLCDIREAEEVRRAFLASRPEIVFHAAALKHVPILEKFPGEAVKTNVFGTANVLGAAQASGAARFVLVSTDKAADPENILGATKRIAEMLVQSAANGAGSRYGAVRFGNVLGSRGSVVPTFMEQIRHGGPVTVTDPAMTRYFMTIPEAIGLVLQTAALAEEGEVFVLDMGEPARIEDLAHRMIRLAGLVPGRDIEVAITGARPGEKTNEVLSTTPLRPSAHPRIHVARPGHLDDEATHHLLAVLSRELIRGDRESIAGLVRDMSREEWQPENVVDLTVLEEFAN